MDIQENVNIFHGLINAIDPSSSIYPEGAAYVSDNSRIDKNGIWNKGPALTNIAEAGHDEVADPANSTTIIRTPNNTRFSCISGAITGGAGAAAAAPSILVTASGSLIGTRQEHGLYYYMAVNYDTENKIESLPSVVKEHWVRRYYGGDIRQADVPVLTGGASGTIVTRWYRSKRILIHKGDTRQLGQANSPIDFYFLGEGSSWNDYANDREIENPERLYKGRGSFRPSSDIDAIGVFRNRVFYFVNETAYFSSAGRPDEVAREYDLTVELTFSNGTWTNEVLTPGSTTVLTLTQKPLLDTGVYAEAIIKIPELLGHSVVRAQEIGNRLWLWTDNMVGYIEATNQYEGFRFVKFADGFGLCSPWTLSVNPYGIFGADKKGIWQMVGEQLKRITEGEIDINDSDKTTYVNPTHLAGSFGCWVEELNEYWWSANDRQIIYQADRDRFVGPYNLEVGKNVAYIAGMYQTYLVRSGTTPILGATRTGIQTLKFWLGQKSLYAVKDQVEVEVIYTGITSAQTVTANVYQNSIASETGATVSANCSHTDDDLIGRVHPAASGRYLELKLSIPSACIAPIAALSYVAEVVPREEATSR